MVQEEYPEMELAKRMATEDLISSLPSTFIETILCSVPIRDAVRTSILSRNWRYNWASIPKLVFDLRDPYWRYCNSNEMTRKSKVCAIHQVLLLHQGPLLEFTLSMEPYKTCVEIDQIILHLSRKNTIKKFTLHFYWDSLYKLPLSVFSFHQLTDLSLSWCVLEFSRTFSGFGNLTSLSLIDVKTSGETLVHLLSNCPLLARLSLDYEYPLDAEDGLCVDLNELVKCLPVIEHLSVSPWAIDIKCFATEELSTTLVSLKSLCMLEMLFNNAIKVLYLFLLIRSSPNLEKIKIKQQIVEEAYDLGTVWNSLDDHSDIWLNHLIELEIQHFTTLEIDMAFVKLILTKSPILKKVRILLANWVQDDEELKMLRILLRFPRASPVAEIIVRREA